MSSKSQLNIQSLIEHLEKQRCTFTDRYRPLLTSQETVLQKANSVIAESAESLKRNYSKKKANGILNDIKNCVSHDVFVLCALAATPSALGVAELGDYVSTIERWWEGVDHPKGLTMVSERYLWKDRHHTNQNDSEQDLLDDNSLNTRLAVQPVTERPQKRKRALFNNVDYDRLSSPIDNLGHERPEAPLSTGLQEARQSSTAFRVTPIGCTSTTPKGMQSEHEVVPESSSSHPKFTGVQEQRVIEHASIQGITKVFEEHMCDAIRRITVQGVLKAAVTTVLPVWGGPVDCLMSLDICEGEVERLALALFNAKVKWVEQVLHIVLSDGITLIVPHSEVTLKGVLDEAIIRVFGVETLAAIAGSPVRSRELEEAKRVTECVSMILTKNGAIINLSLGLEGALKIQNKLYT